MSRRSGDILCLGERVGKSRIIFFLQNFFSVRDIGFVAYVELFLHLSWVGTCMSLDFKALNMCDSVYWSDFL